jgi:hypothetical protein
MLLTMKCFGKRNPKLKLLRSFHAPRNPWLFNSNHVHLLLPDMQDAADHEVLWQALPEAQVAAAHLLPGIILPLPFLPNKCAAVVKCALVIA